MDYYAIGQRIRKLRKARSLTQEILAEMTNVTPTHVSHIENGVTKLSLPVLVAIADALEVRVDSLLYDEPRGSMSIAVEEIAAVLEGCTAAQAQIIADIVRTTKHALDTHLK